LTAGLPYPSPSPQNLREAGKEKDLPGAFSGKFCTLKQSMLIPLSGCSSKAGVRFCTNTTLGDELTLDQAIPREHFEWGLLTNTLVEIRYRGRVVRHGIVDDAMPDSSALWIKADGINPRQMFEAWAGYQVWVTPQELSGDLRYRMAPDQL